MCMFSFQNEFANGIESITPADPTDPEFIEYAQKDLKDIVTEIDKLSVLKDELLSMLNQTS